MNTTLFLLYDGAVTLDFAGPHDVFSLADALLKSAGKDAFYNSAIASLGGESVRLASGLRVHVDIDAHEVQTPHTVIIPGTPAFTQREATGRESSSMRSVVHWLRQAHLQRIVSVCTGAFLLAEAGLLENKRVTTHWAAASDLAACCPHTEVDPTSLYIQDQNLWTSAGVTTGIDLALALVHQDLGPSLARVIAQRLVVFSHRPGNQTQFSASLQDPPTPDARIHDLLLWARAHLGEDLRVSSLAAHCAMSPRHFARLFTQHVGMTPALWVERTRLDVARHLLESSTLSLEAIAESSGFGRYERLRRAFQKHFATAPSTYRACFRHDV